MHQAALIRPRSIPFPPGSQAAKPEGHAASWRINGHLARIVVWTHEEWIELDDRPIDAQFYPCGVWCALRID